ncbi:DUF3471 domain-containing protein [Terrimonas pollutisoli]|uniref:DUF3471 domain-containing protein n=1 Tax=Terrimonas pollutisoli TaxID=3034147 RepID=UPI0023EDEDCA|nr:DUF3471 domain-containing protein [Terrimonas sp. H1YJ31]
MRKFLFLLLVISGSIITNAQQAPTIPATDSLKEYIGKYVFPEGSEVPEIKVALENGVLMGSSSQGSSELKRIEKDVFEVVAYSGMATFKRDEKGKINGLYVEVGNLILDGKKSEEEAPSPGK